jgi:hypothetical protein
VVFFYDGTSIQAEAGFIELLARALAHTGLMVFLYRLPELSALVTDKSGQQSLAVFYRDILGQDGVSPGRVGVIGYGYAGGLLPGAFGDEKRCHPVPRVMLVWNGYCDLEQGLRYLLTGEAGEDERVVTRAAAQRGRALFFQHFLRYVPGEFDREAVQRSLSAYAAGKSKAGEASRHRLADRERHLIDGLLNADNREIIGLAEPIFGRLRPVFQELSPRYTCSRFRFPIWVLHEAGATVIPYTEALALKQLMPKRVHLLVIRGYDEDATSPGREKGPPLWGLLREAWYGARMLHRLGA